MDPGHWFVEDGSLNAAGATALAAGALYVNVHSPAHPGGEIRGQVLPDEILVFRTELAGAQEVPPVDTDASGVAFLTLDEAASLASIHATTAGLDDASDAHLHSGIGGVPGPVEIGLTQDGSDPAHWFVDEAPLSAQQLDALLTAGTYINVHSPDHPGGEIRGQLVPDGFLFAAGLLQGDQEVPRVTSAAGGMFAVTVDTAAMTITTHANTTGADDATAAHLHDAYAGVSGGVAIGLTQDAGNPAHWSVASAALSADQLAAFAAGRWYVNVHTPANPGGEIRGQAAPRGIEVLFSALSGDRVVPPVTTSAGGIAATTMNLDSREFVAVLNLEDADDALSAGIHNGVPGENGPEILPLTQSAMPVSQWSAMAALDEGDFAAYREGALYALVTTPAFPDGELRAQIEGELEVPPPPDTTAPSITLTSPGAEVSGTVSLEADASDDVGVVEVRFLADGALIASDDSVPYAVDWDTTAVANGDVVLTAQAEDAAGNVGTSEEIQVAVENAAAVSFASIQSSVFGPLCSGCHTGPTGGTLPGGMNLTSAANSYAALVGVPSIQVPAMDRVEPGDPDNSYLIRKLEGGPGITGTRMPQGGPFLNQAEIDEIRSWIAEGAPNN
jgi:CHRD domain/Bacterial Ig domain